MKWVVNQICKKLNKLANKNLDQKTQTAQIKYRVQELDGDH